MSLKYEPASEPLHIPRGEPPATPQSSGLELALVVPIPESTNQVYQELDLTTYSYLLKTDSFQTIISRVVSTHFKRYEYLYEYATLEVTQGQILSQSPTDATRFWKHLYGS